jgi:hypothetical protein
MFRIYPLFKIVAIFQQKIVGALPFKIDQAASGLRSRLIPDQTIFIKGYYTPNYSWWTTSPPNYKTGYSTLEYSKTG